MSKHTFGLSLVAALGLSILAGFAAQPGAATPASAAVDQGPWGGGGPNSPGGGQQYDLGSLRGRHGFSYSGTTATMSPVASSGTIRFDGHGHVDAAFTTSVNGMTFTGTFTGTYTVNSNGTGSIVIDLPFLGLQSHGDFVILDRGKGTYFTSTEPGYSVTGSTRAM